MNLTVNGEALRYDGDPRLSGFLQSRGIEPARVAILVNGDLVPLREREGRLLREGDAIEILIFAGGG
jgi:thiamine biosynthesis protein ThiS